MSWWRSQYKSDLEGLRLQLDAEEQYREQYRKFLDSANAATTERTQMRTEDVRSRAVEIAQELQVAIANAETLEQDLARERDSSRRYQQRGRQAEARVLRATIALDAQTSGKICVSLMQAALRG